MEVETKPRRIAFITGGQLTASAAQYLLQCQRAEIRMAEEHRRLLADGFAWDGMDGYSKETSE